MKGVKKAAKLGIRWKLITYFALFVAVILVLLWLFQTVFLDSFYKAIKTRNAQACGDSIVSKINSPNLGDYINELARQNDVCVRVVNGEMRDLYDRFDRTALELLAAGATTRALRERIPEKGAENNA